MSSSLETLDMKSSSVSMPPLEAVVTGVGGAVSGPAEAMILLLGAVAAEDIVASAAFRFRVIGGMMPAYMCRLELCPSVARHCDEELQSAGEQYDSTGKMTPLRTLHQAGLGVGSDGVPGRESSECWDPRRGPRASWRGASGKGSGVSRGKED
jgi:hypothetical protein